MVETCTYHIEVKDCLDETSFNVASPLKMRVIGRGDELTLLAIRCDQAALVGFIRYLHQQRVEISNVWRQ